MAPPIAGYHKLGALELLEQRLPGVARLEDALHIDALVCAVVFANEFVERVKSESRDLIPVDLEWDRRVARGLRLRPRVNCAQNDTQPLGDVEARSQRRSSRRTVVHAHHHGV